MNENNENNNYNTEHSDEHLELSHNYPDSDFSGYNVSNNINYDSSTSYSNDNSNTQTIDVQTIKETPKKGKGKKIASYVAVGLICTVIGGVSSGLATVYLAPKINSTTGSPLYYTSPSNSSVKASTTSATTGSLTVAQIAQKVGPAVVGVSTKSTISNGFTEGTEEGMGSGIIFNDQGYILTNYHVINGADTITVILSNKKEVKAKVINYDQSLDIAVIKITDDVKMPAVAELGNSKDLQVGDQVVAIGNPLGKEFLGSVTAGVVSALNRSVQVGESQEAQTLIQTDAAINSGNSGGPLINSQGQVIGINCAKLSNSSSTSSEASIEGMGFAIPIDLVKPKISALSKPILKIGITAVDITSDLSKENNIPVGVYVKQVTAFSAAEKAGLQTGDVITKFDGKTVKTTDELNSIKSGHKSGDQVQAEIYRDGQTKTITIKLSE